VQSAAEAGRDHPHRALDQLVEFLGSHLLNTLYEVGTTNHEGRR
jgi:hypothetical protein